MQKLAKIFFLLLLALVSLKESRAQCPPTDEVFNYFANTNDWVFCINEGIVDLTTYLNPDYPEGDFFIINPTFTSALENNLLDIPAITSTIPNTINVVPVEYNVLIGGTLCVYSDLTFTGINESPEIDLESVANIDGVTYETSENPILINPLINIGNYLIYINGELQISSPTIYTPNSRVSSLDTITIIYGSGCFRADTFYINISPPTHNSSLFNNENITLYPNPVVNELEISFDTNIQDLVHISICSLEGKQIKNFTYFQSEDKIYVENLNNLDSGIYLISIEANKHNYNLGTFSITLST